MEDVCRDNIARELSDPKGREPHPVCGDWCGGCLPGQKRARWTSQYQVLGPAPTCPSPAEAILLLLNCDQWS